MPRGKPKSLAEQREELKKLQAAIKQAEEKQQKAIGKYVLDHLPKNWEGRDVEELREHIERLWLAAITDEESRHMIDERKTVDAHHEQQSVYSEQGQDESHLGGSVKY